MATFKHNKKRNCGLVYEFLVRRLSQSMVEKDKGNYQKTLEILRKYYSEKTVLAEERELFEVIKNTRGVSESAARRILNEVQKQARKMDVRKIDIKKSNLIKEVNYSFGQGFFNDFRVPEYKLLASIQMVIDSSRGDAILTESVAKIQLEEGLVQYMTTKGSYTVRPSPSKEDIDTLVMKMVAKRFEEKYSKSLSGTQKMLLEKYIRYQVTGDSRPLRESIVKQIDSISKAFNKARDIKEVKEDAVMLNKLAESAEKFSKDVMGFSVGSQSMDETVEHVMMYQKLVEEVESDG